MGKAKILTDQQVIGVLEYVQVSSQDPVRDAVAVLLSFKAGLRVGEIAGLSWTDVCDATGEIADVITVPNNIAKKGSGRTIPMHPMLKVALTVLKRDLGAHAAPRKPVVRGLRSERVSANTLQMYLRRLYISLGFNGVSSHSGRRTFITKAARAANTFGCSLVDVQSLAGHKFIDTTQNYVDRSDRVASLVGVL